MNPMQDLATDIVTGPGRPAGAVVGVRTARGTMTGVAGLRTTGEAAAPMTVDTSHDLASVTKVLATTTALIRLVSQASLRLDDPVKRFLPGFTGGGRELVTIRQLLAHRGGLWDWQPIYLSARDSATALRYVQELPLRYAPDSGRHYSDLGFMLLGRIIEVVTGLGLAQAATELVTGPLGLSRTRYSRPHGAEVAASAYGDAAELAMVTQQVPHPVLVADRQFDGWRTGQIVGQINDGNAFHAFDEVAGHAGMFSTVDDLLRFGSVFASYAEHETLWNPKVVAQFLAPGPDPGQVLGFRSYPTAGGTMYGHPGFVGCVVAFTPDTGTALALCSNRLLTQGTPTPTEQLWAGLRHAASSGLAELS